ncbi:hypothetical protein NQ315_013876 [Exocentrus adspersus]|uniref:Uncharacterized protein n=1 Tax=Exocentrus adspersus TaxID=1586481 RepID=A0AAV8VHZ4_9CUCU|nr:hypothetical protein NQ315_013876 [Exocentrus adspersus]
MLKVSPFLLKSSKKLKKLSLRLLPAKSKRVYEKEMVEFDNWRKKRGLGEGAITEEVLLAYFFNVEKHFAASSMWTKYSMLKSMLKVHKGIDISKYGACRCNELTFLDISDDQDKSSYLYVLIPDTKTNISRSFTVMEEAFSVNAAEMCRKYISLRPKAAGRRFFLQYVDGKCTTQHVGINTISKTFSKVALFLGSLIQKVLPGIE